ncbi:hypothetical protein BJ875DRAFT_541191 [Amylocarpus encephaloides]|uniref:Uncharacterized protein n=1 Tax=Amylocarpus encephaloides TaxID=45428 RepID=A0A9P8C7A8_9HELO|nr:hypothetical protein BJ875DRAFT_541191 [Amylocarpus encephaloides]
MPFSLRHLPPLIIGTALSVGGMIPFFNGRSAMSEYGLPPHIAYSPEAAVAFQVYGSRCVAIGVALFGLYASGNYRGIDALMGCIGLTGFFDGYICWTQGVLKTAAFRVTCGMLVGAWGLLGLTVGKH